MFLLRAIAGIAIALGVPYAVWLFAKWLTDSTPVYVFVPVSLAIIYGFYRIAKWMDRAGWEP